ncbi:MAG: metal-dependent hydrolase [Thermoguttaceae bacterium]|jgi:membrane-bound metal-dependent hydrolase YbcI (DUF457 family)
MNPITHLLASWTLAENSGSDSRDTALIAWAGVAPDLDGLGALVDGVNGIVGRQTFLYGTYHHFLLHGLFAALALPTVFCIWAHHRVRVFVWGFAAVHLHMLCDLVGSRGPDPEDIWPIPYLAPFSRLLTFEWSHQWPLNAWPNFVFTILLIGYVFVTAVRRGHSPLQLFSCRANEVFVNTARARWNTTEGRRKG